MTERQFYGEDTVRIGLGCLCGKDSCTELCRKEGIAQNLYYVWSKEFMKADTRRQIPHFSA